MKRMGTGWIRGRGGDRGAGAGCNKQDLYIRYYKICLT